MKQVKKSRKNKKGALLKRLDWKANNISIIGLLNIFADCILAVILI
jgi:hypothetical protein